MGACPVLVSGRHHLALSGCHSLLLLISRGCLQGLLQCFLALSGLVAFLWLSCHVSSCPVSCLLSPVLSSCLDPCSRGADVGLMSLEDVSGDAWRGGGACVVSGRGGIRRALVSCCL